MPDKQSPSKETLTNSLSRHSCALCRQRKVKCDKKDPCTYCANRGVSCVPAPLPSAPRPRKRRFPEAVLLARLRRYEAALKSYGIDIDSLNTVAEADNTALIPKECRSVSSRSKQTINQPEIRGRTVCNHRTEYVKYVSMLY
ncbi:Transcription factor [Aspergillus sclerotialis]|uniref:Transcription factor n=1 Tax=Aspergillus sclerotialis TaxID=2070753 RepID=A0A3A2ZFX2_9EURO|nr:Transcription factor [Aspergillus sclerotialis]